MSTTWKPPLLAPKLRDSNGGDQCDAELSKALDAAGDMMRSMLGDR